jgi:hypothetical protein
MIGFIIKKAFFDAWDNLVKLIGLNFITLPIMGIILLGLNLVISLPVLGWLLVVLGAIIYVIHIGVTAYFARDIGDCQSISFKDYFKYLKQDFSFKIKFALSWVAFVVITSMAIFYYFFSDGVLNVIPLAIVFWISASTSIAVLFFYSIKIRLDGSFLKVLKKCFILFLDNPGVSIFIFIYSAILVLLSIPSVGLLPPGASAIMCLLDTTVHMYELKYDYIENNPEGDRKKIPWTQLTYELNENIGPRSLRGMIFPWKD